MIADCIVLAGGLGTRLQSVVADKPKCLADINGQPFLYYLCKYLQRFNLHKVIFSVGYKKEMVKDYIKAHAHEFNFDYCFAEEDEPLGTGGAILLASTLSTTEDFFVINGDTFFNVDLNAMMDYQKLKQSDCTLALKPMDVASRYGLVMVERDDAVSSFQEKKEGASGLINGGIYCIYRNAFLSNPFPEKFSFEKEYLEKGLSRLNMYGFIQDQYFIDIGIPEDYEKAQHDFRTMTW